MNNKTRQKRKLDAITRFIMIVTNGSSSSLIKCFLDRTFSVFSVADFDFYYIDYNSKTCLKQPLKKNTKIVFQYRVLLNDSHKYCRMLQEEHYAIRSAFIKLSLPFYKTFVLSIIK